MWTEITRPNYERRGGRYASDLTDREWALIAAHAAAQEDRPAEDDVRHGMRSCTWPRRAASGRCCRTTSLRLGPALFLRWRSKPAGEHQPSPGHELEGREAGPSAGVIDSQSVKTTEIRGYDAGKKRAGVTSSDTLGLLVGLIVHAVQDRDGGPRSSNRSVIASPGCCRRRLRGTETRGRP